MRYNALISSLTDHLQQAVLVIDQNGQVVYCNDSAAQFWQKDALRLLRKTKHRFVSFRFHDSGKNKQRT